MAFELTNFKQIGGPGRFGGQNYSVFSLTDDLCTMLEEGYLDGISDKLNIGDNITLSAADENILASVMSANPVTLTSQAETVDSILNAGVADPATDIMEVSTDTVGAHVVTLEDGELYHRKTFVFVSKNVGTVKITPTNGSAPTLSSVGHAVEYLFFNGNWRISGEHL